MKKKYIVDLTEEERTEVKKIISSNKHSVKKIRRARVLLKADEGWTDEKISEAIDISRP